MAITYRMRGETFQFAQATNEDELQRLHWLMTKSSNPEHRELAQKYHEMGIAVQVSETATTIFEQMTTERFAEVSMIARQVLKRREIPFTANSVTFPIGTQKTANEAGDNSLVTYVLPDGATFEAFHFQLNFKRK